MRNETNGADKYIPDYAYLFEDSSDPKKKTRFIKKILKNNAGTIIISSLVYLLQSAPLYIIPLVTADIIDTVSDSVMHGTDITVRIIIDLVILFTVIFLNIPMTKLRWNMVSKMLRNISAGIKCSLIRKLQSLSVTYHKDVETGKLQAKFLKDTDSVDQLLNVIMMAIIPNIISAVIATLISLYKSGYVSLFFLVVIPCNVALTMVFNKRIRSGYRDLRVNTESMSACLNGMLEMLPVTKSHGLEGAEFSRAENTIGMVKESGLRVDKTHASFGAWAYVTNAVLSVLCLVFCAFLAVKRLISLGDIVLYQSMFASLSSYITGLASSLPQIGAGAEAFESIAGIMNSHDVECNSGKCMPSEIYGDVKFENVSYSYPQCEQDVIQDFSLDVKRSECIAVVGPSGSGKSTLMNLIIGLLHPTQGKILIDGKNIEEYNLSEYRHFLSVVPQNSILFMGTIRENITFGLANYREDEFQKVLEEANVNEFIASFPEGVDTQVGEHGDKLSGGQKQRISIARALMRNPRILILDEATSSLDNLSELHVQQAISSAKKGRTTFIVAHRLSTIRDADRIVVLDEGKIAECGTYSELMDKKGDFYKLQNLSALRQE